jgi:hypothetical protein
MPGYSMKRPAGKKKNTLCQPARWTAKKQKPPKQYKMKGKRK